MSNSSNNNQKSKHNTNNNNNAILKKINHVQHNKSSNINYLYTNGFKRAYATDSMELFQQQHKLNDQKEFVLDIITKSNDPTEDMYRHTTSVRDFYNSNNTAAADAAVNHKETIAHMISQYMRRIDELYCETKMTELLKSGSIRTYDNSSAQSDAASVNTEQIIERERSFVTSSDYAKKHKINNDTNSLKAGVANKLSLPSDTVVWLPSRMYSLMENVLNPWTPDDSVPSELIGPLACSGAYAFSVASSLAINQNAVIYTTKFRGSHLFVHHNEERALYSLSDFDKRCNYIKSSSVDNHHKNEVAQIQSDMATAIQNVASEIDINTLQDALFYVSGLIYAANIESYYNAAAAVASVADDLIRYHNTRTIVSLADYGICSDISHIDIDSKMMLLDSEPEYLTKLKAIIARPNDACYTEAVEYMLHRDRYTIGRIEYNDKDIVSRMKLFLLQRRSLIMINMHVYDSIESNRTYATKMIEKSNIREMRLGTITCCVVGYDDGNKCFIIVNPYSSNWMNNRFVSSSSSNNNNKYTSSKYSLPPGFCWLPYAFMYSSNERYVDSNCIWYIIRNLPV